MITAALKAEALRLGFDLVGVAPAVTPAGIHEFLEWLDRGYAGDMNYLERRKEAYEHPHSVLDGARSVVMLGLNYNTQAPVSRHGAWRRDEASPAADENANEGQAGPTIGAHCAIRARAERLS